MGFAVVVASESMVLTSAQMTYECDHVYHIVEWFCATYRRTSVVCPLNIVQFDGL